MEQIGTLKRPALGVVPTPEYAEAVLTECHKHGWIASLRITPKEPLDIFEINMLSWAQKMRGDASQIGRNEACPCQSGKKFKKCCRLKLLADLKELLTPDSESYLWHKKFCHQYQEMSGSGIGYHHSPTG